MRLATLTQNCDGFVENWLSVPTYVAISGHILQAKKLKTTIIIWKLESLSTGCFSWRTASLWKFAAIGVEKTFMSESPNSLRACSIELDWKSWMKSVLILKCTPRCHSSSSAHPSKCVRKISIAAFNDSVVFPKNKRSSTYANMTTEASPVFSMKTAYLNKTADNSLPE